MPKRVLIVSAAMGDGHNAAADAIGEAIHERWRGCSVERQDTMELRGKRFARSVQASYSRQLASASWSYDLSYEWLARGGAATSAFKSVLGSFFGPPLARTVAERRPDVVISTYPFGAAAVDWARSHRNLQAVTATYIPAFHVHPMWAYPGVDLHFVMYGSAAADARTPGFEQSMKLGAPTVKRRFGAVAKDEARLALGVRDDQFVVLMTGGAWALGGIAAGVGALVELGLPVHVITVCGRNNLLFSELEAQAAREPKLLTVLGYVDNMPELMAASDVVVTNGAGNTVLESLRSGRPVIAFSPLAGHGTASTAELVRRGLALEAADAADLATQVARLSNEPELLAKMSEAARGWGTARDLTESLGELEALYASRLAQVS